MLEINKMRVYFHDQYTFQKPHNDDQNLGHKHHMENNADKPTYFSGKWNYIVDNKNFLNFANLLYKKLIFIYTDYTMRKDLRRLVRRS